MSAIDEAIRLLQEQKQKMLIEDNSKAPNLTKKERLKNTKVFFYGEWR